VPAPSPLLVRRRPHVERHVIALLRGDGEALSKVGDRRVRLLLRAEMELFEGLARDAERQSFTVLRPRAPYVGSDELLLIKWLADAQRASHTFPPDLDERIVEGVKACAEWLTAVGLRLPPRTIQIR